MPELLERDAEITLLEETSKAAAAGEGRVVVIEGPAGIGKSQLLAAAARAAQGSGLTVLRARAAEMEQSFAFGVVRQLLEPALAGAGARERASHLEGAAGLAAPLFDPARFAEATSEAMYPLLHGLFWVCANLSRTGPLALCVDDAHWCDEPSLLFLGFLARRIAGLPIAVVVAARPAPDAAAAGLADLVADATSTVLRPSPLSGTGTAALLEERLGVPSDPGFTEACRASTGGNPFLVGELTQLLASEGIGPTAPMAARVDALGPKAIADSVLLRVGRLPDGARGLVEAVAVLGDGVDPGDAAALAGFTRARADALVRGLRDAGVLGDGPDLTFAHPVLRTAVHESIDPTRREEAHVAAAHLLGAAGRAPERVAAHLLAVPRPLGAWALEPLRRAASQALGLGDVQTAARHLRRALLEEPGPEREAILVDLGHAQLLTMDGAAAETLTGVLAAAPAPALAVRAASDLAILLLFTGRIDEYVAMLTATEALVAENDPALAERLGANLLVATQISFGAAERLASRVAAVKDSGEPAMSPGERASLTALGWQRAIGGRPLAEVREVLARVRTPGDQGDPRDTLAGPMMAGAPLVLAELFDEVHELCTVELGVARARGAAFNAAAALALRSWATVRRGDLLAAETDAREAIELIEAVGFPSFSVAMAQASLLAAALESGSGVGELQGVLDAPAPDPDLGPNGLLILARARGLAAAGRREEALASLLGPGRTVYAEASPTYIAWRSTAAAILGELGRPAEAIVLADDEVARARAAGAPGTLGAALRVRALLAPPAEAAALLEEAVALLAASGARLEHARALTDLGALLRRTGRRVQAREHLRAGHDLAVRCGAAVLASTARQELAASGQRLAAPGLSGAGSLTPSERRVAAMAAEGMRNREIAQSLFVTEKTVETHLSRTYDKLNIRSRRALAELLEA